MAKTTEKRKLVSFRIPENLKRRIDIRAAEMNMCKQYFVEGLLEKALRGTSSQKR